LKISLQDLLQAESKGRWWVVGSAWAGNEKREGMTSFFSSFILEMNEYLYSGSTF
jgi:hypothetical protein